MTDAGIYIQRSLEANPLRAPVLRAGIQSLGLPLGSNGLDAGSGIGLQALLLAEAVGPDGRITGIDIVPELLAFGNDRVRRAGFSDRITFCQGDVSRIPFADDSFDLVVTSGALEYVPLAEGINELARVI